MWYARLLSFALLVAPVFAGTLTIGSGQLEIPEGTVVIVKADVPPLGKVFDQWTGGTSGIDDVFDPVTTLLMPAGDVVLAATYKDDPAAPPPPPSPPPANAVQVSAAMETDGASDPDDMWLWEHPTARANSVLYAADKGAYRIIWYDLTGKALGSLAESGRPNNIDGRGNVVGCSLRSTDEIGLYSVNPSDGSLTKEAAVPVAEDPYGFCLYQSPVSGKIYGFTSGRFADIQQYEIDLGSWTGKHVRTITTGKVEGMAAHDASGRLFFAEETGALRVIGAEPTASTSVAIAFVSNPELTADLEGVALVGDLYILVSSQGRSEFAVYDMAGPSYHWRGNFAVKSLDGPIDSVSNTDGIAWHGGNFGAPFTAGIFFCHDNSNSGGRNLKAVPWQRIASLLGLATP